MVASIAEWASLPRTRFMLTVITPKQIVVVCSLKSMCIPSFILIGSCLSELHAPVVTYCCLTIFTQLYMC